jgi:glutathione S-transferase
MKLYVTYTSPYARLARIVVVEKKLEGRVEILEAKTRTAGSPYYQINPSGRVPYLVDHAGIGMEDSQLICAYLDGLDDKPRFHHPLRDVHWDYRRLEASARFSKFVIQCGTLGHELRKPKGTSNSMILVPLFDLKFLRRTRGTRCRNFKSAALARAACAKGSAYGCVR